MRSEFEYNGKNVFVDLSEPLDISIPIKEGADNPNCYWAEDVKFSTIKMGDFIGNVAEGGPVNYQKLMITPHGNGTHTECYGHISDNKLATIRNCLKQSLFFAQVISVRPEQRADDMVISWDSFEKINIDSSIQALIIRTLPNEESKLSRKYSGTNPPYLDEKIGVYLFENNVDHLVVDLPSVDREEDGGLLSMHKNFWGFPEKIRKHATITELAYVNNSISDGFYLLSLQTLNIESDASPSRPVIYKIEGY